MKKNLTFALVLVISAFMSVSAFADLPIKPVADPWDNPDNLEQDGATYYAYNEAGYVVVWETPECNVDGKYVLVNNRTELTVEYRVTYMESVPWGHVNIELASDEDKSELFSGWVLMADLLDENGKPAAVIPPEIPEHPMISNPIVPKPTPTPTPSSAEPTPTPTFQLPQRPQQAITVSNTYNSAIVYTSVGIAVVALALVAYVIFKHKALNKKGE